MVSIFIISSHLMFGQGLENLLRQEKEIKILGHESNVERAIERIKGCQPEVVIIYRDDTHISSRTIIIEILKADPMTRVIALNLQNNIFFVYQATQWVTNEWEDLVKAIKDNSLWGSQSSLLTTEWPRENHKELRYSSE